MPFGELGPLLCVCWAGWWCGPATWGLLGCLELFCWQAAAYAQGAYMTGVVFLGRSLTTPSLQQLESLQKITGLIGEVGR